VSATEDRPFAAVARRFARWASREATREDCAALALDAAVLRLLAAQMADGTLSIDRFEEIAQARLIAAYRLGAESQVRRVNLLLEARSRTP